MNVSLIVKNVTRIESGITISVGVCVKIQKNILFAKKKKKKKLFGILQHVAAKMANMYEEWFMIQ